MTNDHVTDRAVVLGGSVAGLLAARVLADHHAEVLVLDRDDLDRDDPGTASRPRRGVPQARHIHALLPRGRQVLEELFPGLTAELIGDGAPSGDLLGAARIHLSGHRLRRADSGLLALSLSRAFLEGHVRSRVRRLTNVTFADPCDVLGLVSTPDRRRITGVRMRRRADDSAEEVVDTGLVVDATGRGSRAPAWLERLGYPPPHEERIEVDLGYATQRYRIAPDALDGDWGTLQGPHPGCPRGGALARIEGGRWMLSLFGMAGDHPPTDPEGFRAFARSLPFSDIYDTIRDAEPIDDPVGFRFPASIRQRYERLARFPERLLLMGDSLCSFDPVYGQGMTVAGLEALILREHLRHDRTVQPARFLEDVAEVLEAPWDLVRGDVMVPDVEGRPTLKIRAASAYVARVHAAAAHDPRIATAFVRVMSLVDPPEALLRPRVVSRVAAQHVGAGGKQGGSRRSSERPAAPAERHRASGRQGVR